MTRNTAEIDVHRLRRKLITHSTVGAFVIGILAAGLTIVAFADRLTDAVSDVAASAGRASASAIYEVVNGQHKVAMQITSRTRARVVLAQHVTGALSAESFAEQTRRILSDALGSGEDVAGIVRVATTGKRVDVGEIPPDALWPSGWERSDRIIARGPVQTPTGLRLILAAPINGPGGERLGTDILTVKSDEVAARLASTKMKAGGTTRVYLLHFEAGEPMLLLANGSVEPISQRLGTSGEAIVTAVRNGSEFTHIFTKNLQMDVTAVGTNDWHVVVTQTTAEVFSGLLNQLALVTGAVLLLTGLGAGSVYLLLRPIAGTLIIHADSLANEVEKRSAKLQQANESLMRAEKMASLGNMVAGIAHEINTPVGIILTGASHLTGETEKLKRLYQSDDLSMEEMDAFIASTEEATTLILSNAHRAADLIHSFKQVAVDRTAGERRTFSLKGYINEILLSLRPQLKKRPITVTVDGPDDLNLDSYPGALSQVITNLVMNSLTHGFEEAQEGNITLQFTRIRDDVNIIYHDDGKGIPDEYRQCIFDPFFTTRRNLGGSGLGLNIVFNLVSKILGGTVALANPSEPGSTFVLRLPIRAPQEEGTTL